MPVYTGRDKKWGNQDKRDVLVTVPMTRSERERLRKASSVLGVTQASLLRDVGLDQAEFRLWQMEVAEKAKRAARKK